MYFFLIANNYLNFDILNKELNAKWTETLRYVSYEKLIDFLFFNSLFLL